MKEMQANIGKTTALVMSIDYTGSMNPCINQVKQNLRELVKSMSADIPNLKIGLIIHGDYCDGPNCIRVTDLTDDVNKIIEQIDNAPSVSGGDSPECYELALHTARNMSWPAEGGSLILIGDDQPHEPNYPGNTDKLDWKEEIKALKEKNVNVFPMQCLMNAHRTQINKFWEDVSGASQTPLIFLESFADSGNAVEAFAYAAAGKTAYDNYQHKNRSIGRAFTSNMADNQHKLQSWVDSEATPEETKAE